MIVFEAMIGFNKNILAMKKPWQAWIGALLTANLILPILFLDTLEGKVVFVGMLVAMPLMMALYMKFGFVRLLGLGHAPWLLTVPWLWMRWSEIPEGGAFYYWLLATLVLNSASLVIDGADVARYWRGDRQSTTALA